MELEGFPQDPRYWYREDQIKMLENYNERLRIHEQRMEARAMVEARERRSYGQLTMAEVRAAEEALGIDPYTGIVVPKKATRVGENRAPLFSRILGKRKADGNPGGQRAQKSKKTKAKSVTFKEPDNPDAPDELWY